MLHDDNPNKTPDSNTNKELGPGYFKKNSEGTDKDFCNGRSKKPNKGPRKLRNIGYYIANALKFYDLKDEKLTPTVFVVILFISFSGVLVSDRLANSIFMNIMYTIVSLVVLYAASTIYLLAYLKELRGEEYSLKYCANVVFRKLFRIFTAYIAFMAIIFTGAFLLIVPGLIFYLMFMFNTCYLLNKKIGIIEAFGLSKNLVSGKKMEIFSIIIVFNLILFVPILIIVFFALTSANDLIFNFVISFVTTILTIMQQRLIALFFTDLEYGPYIS